jgi:hypothetical protein
VAVVDSSFRRVARLVIASSWVAAVAATGGACTVDPLASAVPVLDASPPRTDGGSPARDASDGAPDASPPDGGVGDAGRDAGPKAPFACSADPSFPGLISVPEASAAAEVELKPGVRELLVVSDSGRGGAALAFVLPGAGTSRALTLPLDQPAVDDTEGIAWRDGALYTLTSSGGVRRFVSDGAGGLTRDQDLYRLGADPIACPDLATVNCGRNYEGLCLRPKSVAHPCAGYAASKAESKLYCLGIDANGRLYPKTDVTPIALNLAVDTLSDCAFGAEGGPAAGVLVVTTNVFGQSRAYQVHEPSGVITRLPTKSLLNVEAIALDKDGSLFVFDDNSSTQSLAAKATCVGW